MDRGEVHFGECTRMNPKVGLRITGRRHEEEVVFYRCGGERDAAGRIETDGAPPSSWQGATPPTERLKPDAEDGKGASSFRLRSAVGMRALASSAEIPQASGGSKEAGRARGTDTSQAISATQAKPARKGPLIPGMGGIVPMKAAKSNINRRSDPMSGLTSSETIPKDERAIRGEQTIQASQ